MLFIFLQTYRQSKILVHVLFIFLQTYRQRKILEYMCNIYFLTDLQTGRFLSTRVISFLTDLQTEEDSRVHVLFIFLQTYRQRKILEYMCYLFSYRPTDRGRFSSTRVIYFLTDLQTEEDSRVHVLFVFLQTRRFSSTRVIYFLTDKKILEYKCYLFSYRPTDRKILEYTCYLFSYRPTDRGRFSSTRATLRSLCRS